MLPGLNENSSTPTEIGAAPGLSAPAGRSPRRKRVTRARERAPGTASAAAGTPSRPAPARWPPTWPTAHPPAPDAPPVAPGTPAPAWAAVPLPDNSRALIPARTGGLRRAAGLLGVLALAGLLYAGAQVLPAHTAPPPETAAQATLAAITGGYQTALAATPSPAVSAAQATNNAITAGFQTRVAATPGLRGAGAPAPTAATTGAFATAGGIAPTPAAAAAPARLTGPPASAPPTGPPASASLPAAAASSRRFVVRAAPAGIVGDGLALAHPALDSAPDAILLATANWNAGGAVGVYHDHALGVYRTGGQWLVYNQDRVAMPPDVAFNVVDVPAGLGATIHVATAANSAGDTTTLDYPPANGHPEARVLVTANWNPPTSGGVYNDHPVGVAYAGGHWQVFNEDRAPMPAGAAFNVVVLPPGPAAFVQRVTLANGAGGATIVDNTLTNGRPDAILIITPNRTPGGLADTYHGHNVGVSYAGGHWRLFNEDLAPLAPGAAFNVAVWLP